MPRVRTVTSIEDFVGAPGDPPTYDTQVGELWDSGESAPGWSFVLEDDTRRLGRIGFRASPTVTDPSWVGSLPEEELFVFGLWLPWDADHADAGHRLITESLAAIRSEVPEMLEVRINPERHPHADAQRRFLERTGLTLFQEKDGFFWIDDGEPIVVPDRLIYRSIADVGPAAYRRVMAPCGRGTLDRNDRYYWEGCGPENWAAQMTAFVAEEDAAMWLLGYDEGDVPVGYVAVASNDEWGSTIVHIGVHPAHRGNGYVDDLLAAATAAARQAGIGTMLSDVDVDNGPMVRAMRRAGHRDGRRPWHVWVYRGDVAAIIGA